MAESLAVVHNVAKQYLGAVADLTKRRRFYLTLLKRDGRISYNHKGYDMSWPVEMDEPHMQVRGSDTEFTYTQPDLVRMFNRGWAGYVLPLMLGEKEREMMKDGAGMYDYYKRNIPNMAKWMSKDFIKELITIDGKDAGNEDRIDGHATFFDFQAPLAASDRVVVPTTAGVTYAGINIAFKAESGSSWTSDLATADRPSTVTGTGDYPDGTGSASANFATPLGVKWDATTWGTESTLWEDNCWRVLGQTFDWLKDLRGEEDGQPTCALMPSRLLRGYKNYQEAKFRNVIPHEDGADLGFPDTLNQDGVMIKSDYNIPANEVHVINTAAIQISCLKPELFTPKGPIEDQRTGDILFRGGFWGQAWYSPGYFALCKNFSV